MNQFAAFVNSAVLPNAAVGTGVRAANATAVGEEFADILAQLGSLLPGLNAAASKDGAPADFENLLGGGAIASAPAADRASMPPNAAVQTVAPSQLQGLVDLLGALAAANPDDAQLPGRAAATPTGTDNSLTAQLAALQFVLQNGGVQTATPSAEMQPTQLATEMQPAPSMAPTESTFAAQPPQPTAASDVAARPDAAKAPVPQAQSAALQLAEAAVALMNSASPTTTQEKPAIRAQNAAKLAAATNRAPNADAVIQGPPQSFARHDKSQGPSPIAATATAAAGAPNTGADHARSGAGDAKASQPAPTIAAPSGTVLPTLIAAQDFNATLAAAPQAAVPLEALAVHIARKFEAGSSQFEIRLHPAELGQLDISLTVADDGRVQAVLRAERPETLDILQRDARNLEQQLRQAGLDVGSNALSFSLSQGNGGRHAPFANLPAFADANDVANAAQAEAVSKYVAVHIRDGLDISV